MAQCIQGNLSVQEYYSWFITLWTECREIAYVTVTSETLSAIQGIHKISRKDHQSLEHCNSEHCNSMKLKGLFVCLHEI